MPTFSDNPPLGEINGSLTADSRWTVTATGGNCEAWERPLVKHYWWITAGDSPSLPLTMTEPAMLGLYNLDGDCIGVWDCESVWSALAIADAMTEGS